MRTLTDERTDPGMGLGRIILKGNNMKSEESVIGKALIALFPTKRYAPHKSVDSGCPSSVPVQDEEKEEKK